MQANQAGIVDLTRRGGLGDFKILSQGKKVGHSKLWGLERSEKAASLVANLPVPLLTDLHLALPDGRSIWEDTQFETLWPFSKSGN